VGAGDHAQGQNHSANCAGQDTRRMASERLCALVSGPSVLSLKIGTDDCISEMVHPWCDSCWETSFRRFFSVFVSVTLSFRDHDESGLAPSLTICSALHAPGVLGAAPHSHACTSSAPRQARPAPYARQGHPGDHEELLLPRCLRRDLSRRVTLPRNK
jgi:hypothetical protein